jgi:energy-coupling factor transport system ATP-binding protein
MRESSTASSADPAGPVVELRGFSFAYPSSREPVLNGIDLSVAPGGCHLITGDTGCGKSTLLLALKGLLPPDGSQGELRFPRDPQAGASRIGLVMQNPETQLLCPTVGAECAFGLENLRVPEARMKALISEALREVGLCTDLGTSVEHLSMGQKYRLMLASMLVMDPRLLILDEPAAQLDTEGLHRLREIVRRLKAKGIGFVVAEHDAEALAALADERRRLEKGMLVPAYDIGAGALLPGEQAPADPLRNRSGSPAVETRGLAFAYPSGSGVWHDIDLRLDPGERAAIVGANGTGKSTLLRCLCGFLRPERGRLRVLGRKPVPRELSGRVGYLFQNPQRQLFETSVAADVAFTLKRLGWSEDRRLDRVRSLLERCGLAGMGDTSPYRLSYGQQHLAALAAILAPGPDLLLLDDPFVGLDPGKKEAIVRIIREMSDEQGTAVIYAGHRETERFPWAHSRYRLEGGSLVR